MLHLTRQQILAPCRRKAEASRTAAHGQPAVPSVADRAVGGGQKMPWVPLQLRQRRLPPTRAVRRTSGCTLTWPGSGIDEDPLGEGDGWQDWPAFHRVATRSPARSPRLLGIRISVAVAWQRASLRRLDRLRSQLQPPPAQPDRVPVRVSRAGWPASGCR